METLLIDISRVTDRRRPLTQAVLTKRTFKPPCADDVSSVTDRFSTRTDGISSVTDHFSNCVDGPSSVAERLPTCADGISSVRGRFSTPSDGISNAMDRFSTRGDGISSVTDRFSRVKNRFSIAKALFPSFQGFRADTGTARGGRV